MSRRCSNCGSLRVSEVTQNAGFSYGKAIAGQIILGPVGAVAGINGKEKKVFQCQFCGQANEFLMDSSFAGYIDSIIADGDELYLTSIKKSYPGIEWEPMTVTRSFFNQETEFNNAKLLVLDYFKSLPNRIAEFNDACDYLQARLDVIGSTIYVSDITKSLEKEGILTAFFDDDMNCYFQFHTDPNEIRENIQKFIIQEQNKIFYEKVSDLGRKHEDEISDISLKIARSVNFKTIPFNDYLEVFSRELANRGICNDKALAKEIFYYSEYEILHVDSYDDTKVVFKKNTRKR